MENYKHKIAQLYKSRQTPEKYQTIVKLMVNSLYSCAKFGNRRKINIIVVDNKRGVDAI